MIKKALSLVAILGALANGCSDTYKKPEVQATCKVGGLDVQVLYTKNDGHWRWNEDLRSIRTISGDGNIVSNLETIERCDPFYISCNDGSNIYVRDCVLYHTPKREE